MGEPPDRALTPRAMAVLEDERQAQVSAREKADERGHELFPGLCFTTPTGSPRNPDTVTHQFTTAMRSAGQPDLHLQLIRKGVGRLMLASAVDLATVSALLGHSSMSLTASTYAGVMPSLKQDAADRLARLLDAGTPPASQ